MKRKDERKEGRNKEAMKERGEKNTHDSKLVSERQCVYFPLRLGVRQPEPLDGWSF